MASSREYRRVAAECARLAQVAPRREARASFAAAAKSWLILAQLAQERPTKVTAAIGQPGSFTGKPKASDLVPGRGVPLGQRGIVTDRADAQS
jgi:hypothetical protein